MAGSPRYLELLDTLYNHPHNWKMPDRWEFLDERWAQVVQRPDPENLANLARASYFLLSYRTDRTLKDILAGAKELHVAKNAGYAGADNVDPWANFRLSQAFGINPVDGVFVRMSDKYIRITNLRANPDNDRVGESLWDTLADLAAYALIAICLLEEESK